MQSTISPTQALSAWVVADGKGDGRFSDAAIDIAEKSVIDVLACMMAGTSEPGPGLLAGTLATRHDGPVSLIGLGAGASMYDAALVNGMLAHMLDYDDTHWISRGHPSSAIVTTALAVGEQNGLSVRAVYEAYVVGLQVAQFIGSVANPVLPARGYHVTGIVGLMGSTAAASRLMNLSPDQAARAFGIAASMAGGVRANLGTDIKPFHVGRAASGAIQAATLALAGLTACESVLEADNGFIFTLANEESIGRIEEQIHRLFDGAFSIDKAPPLVKLYPCCHAAHAAIEAVLKLRPQVIERLSSIDEIIVEGAHIYANYMIYERPENGLQAKFSNQACVAIPLIDGAAGIKQFSDESVRRPEVQALLPKVRYHTTDRLQTLLERRQMPGCVTIVVDGERLTEDVPDLRGGWNNPCTMDDLVKKFEECADGVLGPERVTEAVELLSNLRDVADVRSFTALLRGRSRSFGEASHAPIEDDRSSLRQHAQDVSPLAHV